MYHNQRDIAARLNTSPSTVTRFLKNSHYPTVKKNNKTVYETEIYNQIIKDFLEEKGVPDPIDEKATSAAAPDSERKTSNTTDKELLQLLKEQLSIKDQQISALNDTVTALNKALDQQQQLSLADKQLLIDGGVKPSENSPSDFTETEPEKPRKGFFARLFGG